MLEKLADLIVGFFWISWKFPRRFLDLFEIIFFIYFFFIYLTSLKTSMVISSASKIVIRGERKIGWGVDIILLKLSRSLLENSFNVVRPPSSGWIRLASEPFIWVRQWLRSPIRDVMILPQLWHWNFAVSATALLFPGMRLANSLALFFARVSHRVQSWQESSQALSIPDNFEVVWHTYLYRLRCPPCV